MDREKNPVILLVEDNDSHAILTKRSLAEYPSKLSVVHVSDGEAALDYLFRRGDFAGDQNIFRPHLVLLDLRLPKIDGLDVLKEMKNSEDLRSIPVVVFTSSLAEPDIIRAYTYYANSYLVKPLEFSEFKQQILTMASYWIKWNIYPL